MLDLADMQRPAGLTNEHAHTIILFRRENDVKQSITDHSLQKQTILNPAA